VSLIEKGRPGGVRPYRGEKKPRRRLPLLLFLLLVAALGALWWLRAREDAIEPPPAPAEAPLAVPAPLGAGEPPAPEPEPSAGAALEPAPAEPLPALAESDPLARELGGRVSSHPLFAAALKEAGVVERFVAVVDQLAEGNAPRRDLDFLRPGGRFLVLGQEPALQIDPASYRRYDALAQAVAALDARAVAAAYQRIAPLCEESYRALGYPEGGFDERLRTALTLLGSTPRIDDTPALVAQVKRYEFADPNLENLADAQKQLLRMGPRNAKLVADKLREIEAAL
jgi:Protein of unknown function (DUF3014)